MSLSKIVVTGRVVRAAEKRFTPNTNIAVTEFAIAVESLPRQDGSIETQPVKVICWRDLAERCAQEVKKGDLVAVDGRLQINNFTGAEGQRKRDAEIEATAVENLSQVVVRGQGNQTASPHENAEEGPSFVSAAAKPYRAPGNQQSEDLDAIFASEDEIPF